MKQDDLITLTIESQGVDGVGIGKCQGFTVFVPYALAGDQIVAKVDFVNRKKSVVFASLKEVQVPSQNRVEAPCPVFGKCGGCNLQNATYQSQLQFKAEKVKKNFAKLAGIDIPLPEIVASPLQFGYRNKIALPVSGKKGKVVLGMYKTGTHQVVSLPNNDCLLCQDWAKKVAVLCQNFFNESKIEPYNSKYNSGLVKHVVARFVDGQLLLTVVATKGGAIDYAPLKKQLDRNWAKWGLYENVNSLGNNVILSGKSNHVDGIEAIQSEMGAIKYFIHPDSFFQVNTQAKDLLYKKVKEFVQEFQTEVLLDCFSGVGLLTASLYDESYDTFAFEIEPSATQSADQMKIANNLVRLQNVCGDVLEQLPKVICKLKEKKTTAVVDPPRKGLSPQVIKMFSQNGANNVVYVSCDSATLARDVGLFVQDGYSISKICCFDLFPNTDHVESLVCLQRQTN
ncbi:MAG: 23S rRNA (uracil(1939)-C(5))-methyltransferase RlmD [Clostridia bacterium]|nr:23S rRNA (uracil(1939)-C(5))-methyltransferase RlmD [Clostridia bacterium]